MIFLFWDTLNDSPEILAEDGEFWSYSEDSVAIKQGLKSGRSWYQLEKLLDVTPLNEPNRFDVYDELLGDWVSCQNSHEKTWAKIQKLAGVKDWKEVF